MWSTMLRSVITQIKNILSHVKNCLSSLISPCSSGMSLNCLKDNALVCSACMSLNCQGLSRCMTINCPPHCLMKQYHSSRAHGPCDCLTIRMDDMMYSASIQNCSDLDLSSSMDSLQTHDSLITPESPRTYSPSPCDSLEEGRAPVTQVSNIMTDDSVI